jgi:epoxyqueuosine reductase
MGQGMRHGLGMTFVGPQPFGRAQGLGSSYNLCVNTTHHSLSDSSSPKVVNPADLWASLQQAALDLGFSQIGVTGVNLSEAEPGLLAWLEAGFHGSMNYMASHGLKRARPAELVPGTVSVITVRLNYLPQNQALSPELEMQSLQQPQQGVVSVYARGRDYHKVLRSRLQLLQEKMAHVVGPFGHRVFTDSAPVMEAELSVRSGQGWRGKNTLVLNRDAGSFFFLGELFVDLALEATPDTSGHCGHCTACLDLCPTQAIVAPYQLDARRCISYLTIEHAGPIPEALRPLIGNRIYGCDDCQWVCPWNKYAKRSTLPDFDARKPLVTPQLIDLLNWDEVTFLKMTEGSAIRRIGHARWLRNVALAAGNALAIDPQKPGALPLKAEESSSLIQALAQWRSHPDPVVQEQVQWSLKQAKNEPT